MIPFQASDIMEILYSLLSLFVKQPILDKLSKLSEMVKLDIDDKSNIVSIKDVEIGFAARKNLKSSLQEKKVTDQEAYIFKKECLEFLKTMTRKIFEKNPLKYPVVRLSRCLDPSKMGSDEDEVAKTFSLLLADLINKRLITESEGEAALLQMKLFIQEMRLNSSVFEQFDKKSQRLDAFFSTHLTGVQKFCDLFKVIKFILILTHGQASVERGFSVNKEMIVENLKSESQVARRLVYDELQDKAVHDIIITKEMLASSRAARMRYHNYLEEEKKKKVNEETRLKRTQMEDSLNDLKNKKMKIEKSMNIMLKEADEMCLKAEKQSNFSLLAKSNAYRKKAAESAEEVRNITKEIEKISSAK